MNILTQTKQQFNLASDYLTLLASDTENFTFQTFPDCDADKINNDLTRTLHGSLKQHFDLLCDLNNRGAGIFITVQETNLKGRKEVDVLNIRAYFCDHDDVLPDNYHLDPTFIVKTSGDKGHSYWVLNEYEISDKSKFQSLQNKLIDYYQSDKACKDLARVMRLPGFFHNKNKDNPEFVKMSVISDKAYSKQEIHANLPTKKVETNSSLNVKKTNKTSNKLNFRDLLEESTEVIMKLDVGNRNNTLFDRTLALAKRAKQLNDETLLAEIKGELTAAAELSGLTLHEIDRTINSAFDTGFYKESIDKSTAKTSKVELMSDMVKQLDLKFDKLNDVILLDNKAISESQLWEDLCIESGIDFNFESLMRVIQNQAQSNIFCPIQEYLKSLPINNNPDTILDKLYQSLHVTEDLHKVLIRKWLISAVARALQPGCQADNALVFYSQKQGLHKTSFFRELFGVFFQTLGHHKSEVDELQSLYKKWCAEHGEIEFAISKKEVGRLKGFLTQTEDTFRGSYDRRATTKQRHFVFCGSTNEEFFLKDTTGNRRFWVVEITQKIDIDFVKNNRDLIWSAVLNLYQSGEIWYLKENQEELLKEETKRYQQENLLIEQISGYISFKDCFTVADIALHCLGLENRELINGKIKHEITSTLKQLGYEKDRRMINGKRTSYWIKSKDLQKIE